MSQLDKNIAALPELCYGVLPSDKSVIIIKRGESGYHPTDYPAGSDKHVNTFNKRMGVTRAQRMAMESGSLFGWELPIADPAVHEVAAMVEQVKELPGTEPLVEEIIAMKRAGATTDAIRVRFNRILAEARPDLVAEAVA